MGETGSGGSQKPGAEGAIDRSKTELQPPGSRELQVKDPQKQHMEQRVSYKLLLGSENNNAL